MAHLMVGGRIVEAVEKCIKPYPKSRLKNLVAEGMGAYAIKFVKSRWAVSYLTPAPLKISETPALTWGTATYVTPLAFPLSSALYGRVGLVTDFDPSTWRIFDATDPVARMAYIKWARVQPAFSDLVLTVHSTRTNQLLRNKFREDFKIDCVLFNPDQEAELHTDRKRHVWMAVTDWNYGKIESKFSLRLGKARFTVLIDDEFALEENGLPIERAERQIERATLSIPLQQGFPIGRARLDPSLPSSVINTYNLGGYLHLYIEP